MPSNKINPMAPPADEPAPVEELVPAALEEAPVEEAPPYVAPEPEAVPEPPVAEAEVEVEVEAPVTAPSSVPEPEPVPEPTAPPEEVPQSSRIAEIDRRIEQKAAEHDTLGNKIAVLEQKASDMQTELKELQLALVDWRESKRNMSQEISNLRTLRSLWPDEVGEEAVFATRDPSYVELVRFTAGGLTTTRLQLLPANLRL